MPDARSASGAVQGRSQLTCAGSVPAQRNPWDGRPQAWAARRMDGCTLARPCCDPSSTTCFSASQCSHQETTKPAATQPQQAHLGGRLACGVCTSHSAAHYSGSSPTAATASQLLRYTRLRRLHLPQRGALERLHHHALAIHLLDGRLDGHAQHGGANLEGFETGRAVRMRRNMMRSPSTPLRVGLTGTPSTAAPTCAGLQFGQESGAPS